MSSPHRSAVQPPRRPEQKPTQSGLATPLALTAVVLALAASTAWARRWLASGAAIETLLVIYGDSLGSRIFPDFPLWTLLAIGNVLYAVASTSWLFYAAFSAGCYVFVGITCLMQFEKVAKAARKNLRLVLKQLHFTRDKIALFNLPALEIDTDLDGLFVIRGVTISLSSLTIVAHGIELGLKLADEIELSMCAEEVRIPLFRRVEVGDVFGSVKGGKPELFFGDLDDQGDTADDDISVLGETPLLRAATLGAEGYKDRPKLRESLTGVSWMKDSSAKAVLESVTTLSPDEDKAEKQYLAILKEIRNSSVVQQARLKLKSEMLADADTSIFDDDKDTRAAICAELRDLPSIAHPPPRSVRVTTLQTLSPPHIRRFMQRLPFLYRLLLAAISYFHSVNIKSINVAASGQFTAAMLQQQVFKHYATDNAELRRLERKIKTWLADANFCLQLADINGLATVPLSTSFDIVAYLKFNDILAYRTVPEIGTAERVVRLGGADARATIPSFLMPHHEHLVPPKPTAEDEERLAENVEDADGVPKTEQAKHDLEKAQKDETNVTISVHASLPAAFDQSVLNFIAALVKATKIIEFEKEVDSLQQNGGMETPVTSPTSPTLSPTAPDDASITSTTSDRGANNFKSIARNIRTGLKDGSAGQSIKELAKDLQSTTNQNIKGLAKDVQKSTKHGMRKALGGMVNDRWIAKMVGKVAAKLQQAQGDLGYSGEVPIALAPYRAAEGLQSKLLP